MIETTFGRGADSVPDTSSQKSTPFTFHGTGKEYFGIWIVNILLSIVTLGIYSAWAKVRTKRYFNGNTELDGHRFDYHADPIAILKGRIVVFVVLIAFNLLSQLNPILAIGLFLLYAVALPWVIIRGLRFNANMTSYRNVRFHFEGLKRTALAVYVLLPIVAFALLGLLIPIASRANARFLGNGHRFGTAKFAANPPLKPYYKALGIAYLFAIGPIALLAFAGYMYFTNYEASNGNIFIWQVMFFLAYGGFAVAYLAYAAITRNIGFNNLSLQGGHGFTSTVNIRPYVWIALTNFLLSIVTLGLFIPWAKVRMASYLAANTTMNINGSLDGIVAGQADGSGVTSGEFLDIEGMDFGF
nr:putative DUF898 domain-containing protein [uncultured bacterium]